MKKIRTLFKKDPNDLGRVIDELNDNLEWIKSGEFIATRKYDGSSCMVKDGLLYKRYDAKKNRKTGKWKSIPKGAIPCQDPDEITGHHPHWILVDMDAPENKYHYEGWCNLIKKCIPPKDGTYELIGEKLQGNPEKIKGHELVEHVCFDSIITVPEITFKNIKNLLENNDIEGLVFHELDAQDACKIRKTDFGIKR